MHKLKTEEYLPYAPDDTGHVRINHDSIHCTGSSKSMRVSREEDGTVSAKCYRCGGWGKYSTTSYTKYNTAIKSSKLSSKAEVYMPYDAEVDIYKWPAKITSKLNMYHITQEDITNHGIIYSKRYNRVVVPIYKESKLVGWQGRSYDEGDDIPKYITKYKDMSDLYKYIYNDKSKSDCCVIVEDVFSAIRCSHLTTGSLALMGNSISDSALDLVTTNHDKFLIFLDRDNRQVKMNGIAIKDRLTAMGKGANIVVTDRDPKEYSLKNLETTLLDNLKSL